MTPEDMREAEARFHDEKAKKLRSQRKQAWVVFSIGVIILLVTVIQPVIGSLAPLFDWGCKEVRIDRVPTLVCADPKAPWGFTMGMIWGISMLLWAAAFRQEALGDVGKALLSRLPGAGGKKKE